MHKTKFPILLLLMVAFVFSIFSSNFVNAAGETYTYASSGSKISAKGGKLGASTTAFTKSPVGGSTGKDKYTGVAEISDGSNGKCKIGLEILVASGSSSGAISAPSYANGLAGAGASGQDSVPSCDKSFAASVSDFNKSITIAGSTNNSTPIDEDSIPETQAQKDLIVTVYSDKPISELPEVKATIVPAGNNAYTSESKTIEWNSSASVGSARWQKEAGSYSVCIVPASAFTYAGCKTVTKVAKQVLNVEFGSASTAYNEKGKLVEITVRINSPAHNGVLVYGPVNINLLSAATGTPAGTATTNTKDSGVEGGVNVAAGMVALFASIDPVEPGEYEVCIDGHSDMCASFTKVVNQKATVYIDVSEEDSKLLLANIDKTACAIDGIGWIVCPILGFLATVTDTAFDFLASSFLDTDTSLVGTDTATYSAWSVMRNIANVAFVIAFLVIIFSQLSNVGITNYGVKKMLPRLIIAAILVNISFFVCQVAVDLSNILGYSLKDVFDSLGTYMQTPAELASGDATGNGFGIATIIVALLAGGITLAFAISIPVLLATIVALLMIVLILVARTALIVLLVVVSPLAFVAYLLPNTEDWFKKWGKMFAGLLLVFPIISIVFGASALAAGVIKASAPTDNMVQLIAIGVAVVPLFVVPSLLRNSMNAAGSIGTKLAGWSNKTSGRIGGKVNDTSRLGQYNKYRQGEANKRRALIQSGAYEGKGGRLNPRNWASTVNKGINNSRLSGDFGNKQAAAGVLLAENQEAEETKAAAARLRSMKPDRSALRQLSQGGVVNGIDGSKDTSLRAAAIQSVVASNDIKGMNDLWSASRTWSGASGDKLRTTLADSLQNSSGRPAYFGQGAIAGLRVGGSEHNLSAAEVIEKAIKDGAYSPARIATADKDELAAVADIANSSVTLDVAAHQKLVNDAHTALTDPELARTIGKNLPSVEQIRGNIPHNPNEERFV